MELSAYALINLICVVVLGLLGLRRLIRMEEYHDVLVVVVTPCLWALAFYLFALAFLPSYPPCLPGEELLCPSNCVIP